MTWQLAETESIFFVAIIYFLVAKCCVCMSECESVFIRVSPGVKMIANDKMSAWVCL